MNVVTSSKTDPVFIIGVLNRSGTNFLSDTLLTVSDFEMPILKEDYVLEHSSLLIQYGNESKHRWKKRLGENESKLIYYYLGQGLLNFLRYGCNRNDSRLLVKTPRSYGINNFFDLFPNGKLLIMVRDGRDTVESATKSFTYASHHYWIKQWKTGAQIALDFMKNTHKKEEGRGWLLIKYEDLFLEPEKTVPNILSFLDIPPKKFDWKHFQNLPLRGSSTVRGNKQNLHWQPVEKPKNFNPIGKWQNWFWWQKFQFKKIAGKELIEFGYVDNNRW